MISCNCKENYHEQIDELQKEVDDLKELMGKAELLCEYKFVRIQDVDMIINILNETTDWTFERVGEKNVIAEHDWNPVKKFNYIEHFLHEFDENYGYTHDNKFTFGGEEYAICD